MKQPAELPQAHRSKCWAGEYNLASFCTWPLLKVTVERCPPVLRHSCQAGLGSRKRWPLHDQPRRVRRPTQTLREHTLHPDAPCQGNIFALVSVCFLRFFTKPRCPCGPHGQWRELCACNDEHVGGRVLSHPHQTSTKWSLRPEQVYMLQHVWLMPEEVS